MRPVLDGTGDVQGIPNDASRCLAEQAFWPPLGGGEKDYHCAPRNRNKIAPALPSDALEQVESR
jgi:hypothetical protein